MSARTTKAPLAGRYVLLDQVGSGGMGSVWRARDRRTGAEVAVKVLGAHDSSMLLRFVREQSLRIQHPHVVAPTGWAAEDHLVVLAMDLVRGGSLDALLRRHGPLPASYVVVLLEQLLQALDAVHAAGVVHRDVKPANLLLEPTGTGRPWLRLGDFGVATLAQDVRLTREPGLVGTDGYLAPEQVAGAPPDPRQDLYAAGVVAAQLLSGRPPRPGVHPDVPGGPTTGVGRVAARERSGAAPGHGSGGARAAAAARRTSRRAVAGRHRPAADPAAAPRTARADVAIACFASVIVLCAVALHLMWR